MPQVEELSALYDQFPNATWVLNTRPMEHWMKSVNEWNDLRERFVDCDIPGLPAGEGDSDDELRQFFIEHDVRIRDFVEDHPSLKLIEFDVEDVARRCRLMTSG